MFARPAKAALVLFLLVASMAAVVAEGAVLPVQGIGEATAINEFQLKGTATIRVGTQVFPVGFTATILSLQPGPGQTLLGTTSHFVDFDNGNTFTTMDTIFLIPTDTEGNYEFVVKATIIEGTGTFEGATGELTWKGTINLAIGHAVWRLHGYIQ